MRAVKLQCVIFPDSPLHLSASRGSLPRVNSQESGLVPQEVIHVLCHSLGKRIAPDPLKTIPPENASQEPGKIFHLLKFIFSCDPSGCSMLSLWLTFSCFSLYPMWSPQTGTTHAYTKSSRCHKPEAPKFSMHPRIPPTQPFSHTCEIFFQRHQPTHLHLHKKHLTCKLSQVGLSKPGS